MKHPSPSQVCRNRSSNDGRKCRDRCENHVENRQSDTSFMHEIKIPHRRKRHRLVRHNRHPFNNPPRKKLIVRIPRRLTDNRPHNPEYGSNQKLGPFPIDPRQGTHKWTASVNLQISRGEGRGEGDTPAPRQREPDTPIIARLWQWGLPSPLQW